MRDQNNSIIPEFAGNLAAGVITAGNHRKIVEFLYRGNKY